MCPGKLAPASCRACLLIGAVHPGRIIGDAAITGPGDIVGHGAAGAGIGLPIFLLGGIENGAFAQRQDLAGKNQFARSQRGSRIRLPDRLTTTDPRRTLHDRQIADHDNRTVLGNS